MQAGVCTTPAGHAMKRLPMTFVLQGCEENSHVHVCRRVTDDVIRSLFVAQELLHTKVILLVHHTGANCFPSIP